MIWIIDKSRCPKVGVADSNPPLTVDRNPLRLLIMVGYAKGWNIISEALSSEISRYRNSSF